MTAASDNITLFDDWLHEQDIQDTPIKEIHLVRSDDDFRRFTEWLFTKKRPLAYDIEATGLDIFSPQYEIKSIQWGDIEEAFVFIWKEPWFQKSIDIVMNETDCILLAHNASYDALALERHGHVVSNELLKRTYDTKILSHLADPRSRSEGGVGHGLKNLAAFHVDKNAPDGQTALKKIFRDNKWSDKEGWKNIPATHPTLVHYAGMDVVLTARLYPKLKQEIQRQSMQHLVKYEHKIMRLVADMERRGMRIDIDYAEQLAEKMTQEEQNFIKIANDLGVSNPNATRDVAAALQNLGVELTETTEKSGDLKVDKMILTKIANDPSLGKACDLANAVMSAKNNAKWRDAYVIGCLEGMDSNGRVHPMIGSLGARTGRMSISNPPLQQLPSGNDAIRRMFLAEEGCRMASIDFSGVELRVLAALSQDPVMLKVFQEGGDLHQMTADSTGITRKLAKTVNFGKVYGGGPKGLARQTGLSEEEAKVVCDGFDNVYKGVNKFSYQLSAPIKRKDRNYVITHTGRKLPVDADRSYAALNYCIQSTARDVLGKAMIKLAQEGFWKYALLPIHDEVLFSFPEAEAEELCKEAGCKMEMILKDVHITSEPDLGGASWGTLYTEGEHSEIELKNADRYKYCDEDIVNHLKSSEMSSF
jgi:DNA polymerase-1